MNRDLTLWGGGERRELLSAQGLTRQGGASGRFATPEELNDPSWAFNWNDPTVLAGHVHGSLIGRRRDDRHVFVCAASRSGKGTSVIVPNIVNWPGSIVVNDPKGELARMTARAKREQGFDVHILDPSGTTGQPVSSFNPLDEIDLASPRAQTDIALLWEAMLPPSNDVANSSYWDTGSRGYAGLFTTAAKVLFARPTMTTVHDMISGKHGTVLGSMERPSDLLGPLLHSDALNGALRAGAISILEIPEKEQASHLSNLRRKTAWMDGQGDPNAGVTRTLASSTLRLANLKRRRTAIYLCLPARDMHAMSGLLRTVVMQTVAALEATPSAAGMPPTLMVLDELPVLGHMPVLEKAIGLIAGSGVRILAATQDLGQLKAIYPKSWGSFVGNSCMSLWFGFGGDGETAEYVSQRLGVTQYYEQQEPGGSYVDRMRSGHLGGQGHWATAPLLYPHEVERAFARETGRLLALSPGWPPAILNRVDIRDGFLKEWIDA